MTRICYGLLLVFVIVATGCLGPVRERYPEERDKRPVPVYVVSHGWHVGVVFRGQRLREILPDHDRLPQHEYLMVGWGDNKYYPSERVRVDLFLRAAFWPTGSVLHLVGFNEPVDSYFRQSEIVRLQLSEQGVEKMTGYIADRFQKEEGDNIVFVSEGLYSNSAFFKARGWYFFPQTSNKWTARVLRESGLPVTPFYAITSGNVMKQARKSGEVIQKR